MHHLRLTFHRQPPTPIWCKIGILGHFAKMAPRDKLHHHGCRETNLSSNSRCTQAPPSIPSAPSQHRPLQPGDSTPARLSSWDTRPPKVIEVRIFTNTQPWHYVQSRKLCDLGSWFSVAVTLLKQPGCTISTAIATGTTIGCSPLLPIMKNIKHSRDPSICRHCAGGGCKAKMGTLGFPNMNKRLLQIWGASNFETVISYLTFLPSTLVLRREHAAPGLVGTWNVMQCVAFFLSDHSHYAFQGAWRGTTPKLLEAAASAPHHQWCPGKLLCFETFRTIAS